MVERASLKGVGKVYMQVVIDTFRSLGLARVYNSKLPIPACDMLHGPSFHRIFPLFDASGGAA
jgi:hypothetical protein